MKTWLLVGLCLVGVHRGAMAQEREPDVVYLSGVSVSSNAVSGGGGEVQWMHALSPRSSVIVGGTSTSLGGAWWTYGTVEALTRRRDVFYGGRVSLGSGRHTTGGFAYAHAVGTVTAPIARDVHVEVQGQYARAANAATTVLMLGASYSGIRNTRLRLGYYTVFSDVVDAHHLSGQGEVTIGRVTMLGGLMATARATADVAPDLVDLMIHATPAYFAGASIPVRRAQVLWAAEVLPQTPGHLVRLTMTLKLPLGPR